MPWVEWRANFKQNKSQRIKMPTRRGTKRKKHQFNDAKCVVNAKDTQGNVYSIDLDNIRFPTINNTEVLHAEQQNDSQNNSNEFEMCSIPSDNLMTEQENGDQPDQETTEKKVTEKGKC